MEFIVDTCVIIDYLKKKPVSSEVFKRLIKNHTVYFSSISVFELFVGIKEEEKRKTIKENLLGLVKILPFDSECAQIAAVIERELREKGQVIGPKDTMIAAKSLAKKVPIVTSNIRHFKRIENLDLYGTKELLEKLEK